MKRPGTKKTRMHSIPGKKSLFLLLCFLVAAGLLMLINHRGMGLSIDSVFYLRAAAFEPGAFALLSPRFAPLYSLTIALLSNIFSLGWYSTARYMNILFFGVSVTLFASEVLRYTGKISYASLSALMLIGMAEFIHVNSMLWSEGFFIFLLGIWLFFIIRYASGDGRVRFLVFAAFVAALASVVRYAGLSIIATSLIIIHLYSPRAKRVSYSVLFSFISVPPILAYIISNSLLYGSLAGRRFELQPGALERILAGVDPVFNWFLIVDALPTLLRIAAFLLLSSGVIISLLLMNKKKKVLPELKKGALVYISLIFAIIYISMLFATVIFFDSHTLFDYRILSPLIPFTAVMLTLLVKAALERVGSKSLKTLIIAVAVLFLTGHLLRSYTWFRSTVSCGHTVPEEVTPGDLLFILSGEK